MHNWTGVVLWLVGTLQATYINKNGQDVNVSHLIFGWLLFGVHIVQPSVFAHMDQLSIGVCIVPGMNQLLWYYADLEKKACQVKMFAVKSLLELLFLKIEISNQTNFDLLLFFKL